MVHAKVFNFGGNHFSASVKNRLCVYKAQVVCASGLMGKRGISSWLSAPAAAPEPAAIEAAEAAEAGEATDSPLDVGMVQLRGAGNAGAAIERISPDKRAAVEQIDEEEDDAEFEERAHWARRRKKPRKAVDRSQPSIALFCVPKDAPVAQAGSEAGPLSALEATEPQTGSPGKEQTGGAAEAKTEAEAAPAAEALVETPVRTPAKRTARQQRRLNDHTPSAASDLSVDSVVADSPAVEAERLPARLSGRPKRQAAVRAEQLQIEGKSRAQALSDETAAFLTPPPRSRRHIAGQSVSKPTPRTPSPSSVVVIDDTPTSSAKKKRGEASPDFVLLSDKSAATNGGRRKRKLDMDKKKSPTGKTQKGGAAAGSNTKAAQSFFLTEQERKQLQEIEAVTTFREELRKTREKDLAFFTGTKSANPFFQASAVPAKKKKNDEGVDGDDSVDVDKDSPDRHKKSGKKWMKEKMLFPRIQHVISTQALEDSDMSVPLQLPPRRSAPLPASNLDMVVLEDEDDASRIADLVVSGNVKADEEMALSDMFWFRDYPAANGDDEDSDSECDEDDGGRWVATLSGTDDDFISYVVDTYGIREKRVRELFTSLEVAKQKRLSKQANLSLVDRYTPVMASGIVGNKEPMRLLSSWLSAWKSGGNGRDRNSCFQSELYAFEDDSEDDSGSDLHRLFILDGASGSGKSAAVYACAEELGYQVIEINAAQNRSGKSIVEIAGEATQSTRVLRVGGDSGGKKSKKATPPKKKTKASSSKRKSIDSSGAPSQLSLVLFEDVDVVFDEDRGFLSSLCSIAKRSKCPIVVTCAELPENFPSTPARLYSSMARPSKTEFSAWVMLVAHLEHVALVPSLVNTMAQFFQCDIRHALHFLQANLPELMSATSRAASLAWRGPGLSLRSTLKQASDQAKPTNDIVAVVDAEIQEGAGLPHACSIQAWATYNSRSFDVLLSNLLPELSAASKREMSGKEGDEQTEEQKHEDIQLMNSIANAMDAASLADTWVTMCDDDPGALTTIDGQSDALDSEKREQLLERLAPTPALSV